MHNGQIGCALRPLSWKVWAFCLHVPHMAKMFISYATLQGRETKRCMSGVMQLQPCMATERKCSNMGSVSTDVLHLEEVDVSIWVAEAENILLFGVLWDGLDDAVLGQKSVARQQLLLRRAFTVSLVEQQCTSCKRGSRNTDTKTERQTQMRMSTWCRKQASEHHRDRFL